MATASPSSPQSVPHGWTRVLPEILGYVGAALVASAALNLVAQSWEDWSDTVRLLVLIAATVVLAGPALGIAVAHRGRVGLADHGTQRRLVALMLALSAALVAATAHQILVMAGIEDVFERSDPWVLVPAAAGLVVAILGAWLAPGVLATLGVAGLSGFAAVSGMSLIADQPAWVLPILIAGAGAIWLALTPLWLMPPVLAEALGVAWIIVGLMPQALIESRVIDPDMPADQVAATWWARGLLLAFAAAALTVFARGGSWAWAVGGVIAAAIGALAVAGSALGWITGMLVAGVVLLALSGVLLLVRRRGASPSDPASDPASVPTSAPGR